MSHKIWVGCLAAYNNGCLYGEWIDVSGHDRESLFREIQIILKNSPEPDAEEWAVMDYEGFEYFQRTEYPDLGELCDYVEQIENSDYDEDLIEGVMCNLDCNVFDAISYIDDNYCGEYESLEEWADQHLTDSGCLDKLPRELSYYFDYSAYARDQEMCGYIFTIRAGGRSVYVLYNS